MSDTVNAIRLSGSWVDLNTAYSIPVGSTLVIQNQASSAVELAVSASEPEALFRGMMIPPDASFPATVIAEANPVWVRGVGPISVQVVPS